MVNLTISGQYFSLETVISEIYAKFPVRMMLSPNSTHDVRLGFCLPEWSLDYYVVMGIIYLYSNACDYYLVYLDTNFQKEAKISCV